MRHMLDIPKQLPTMSAAEARRAELHADIDAYLARGGQIHSVEITARGWGEPDGLQEHIDNTARVSYAMMQEMKHAPKAAPKKKKGLMSPEQRLAKRKADALERASKPCAVIWDGKECGGTRYSRGTCLNCKRIKSKIKRAKQKHESAQ